MPSLYVSLFSNENLNERLPVLRYLRMKSVGNCRIPDVKKRCQEKVLDTSFFNKPDGFSFFYLDRIPVDAESDILSVYFPRYVYLMLYYV